MTGRPARLALLGLAALAAISACVRVRPPAPPALRVGVPADYPPFAAAAGGDFAGLDVDVARRFAADTGRPLTFVAFRWPTLVADLAAGRFDLAMGGITMRPERALAGSFTRPVLETGALVLARPGVDDVDRRGTRLGVNGGGHLERVARRLFPHAFLRATADNQALGPLLADGEVDALLTDDVEAPEIEAMLPGLHRLGPFTRDRKAYLGRDRVLVADLDTWLRRREADGTLDRLRARWLGDGRRLRRSAFDSDLAALVALVDLRLSLMPAVAAAKERAARPVEDPAQEARVVAAARQQAGAAGLDPDTGEALARALIAAARAVQHAYLTTPPALRLPVDTIDLEREARPALETISAAIVTRAADVARDGSSLGRVAPADVAARLDPALPLAGREQIGQAVVGLRPVQSNRGL